MLEIENENFKRHARIYCHYCLLDHWVDITELANYSDENDDRFILEFDSKDKPGFLYRLREAFSRIDNDLKTIDEPVEIVAISIPQAHQLITELVNNSDLELESIHKFPKIEWEETTGLGGMQFGKVNVDLREITLSFDLTKSAGEDSLYIEPIEIGWRSEENETYPAKKLSWIDLMKRRLSYLFIKKDYLYHHVVGINEQQAKILFSLIELLTDEVVEVKRRDGSIIYKVLEENIMLRSD